MRQAKVFSPNESFKASRGWLDNFMKRKGLSLRRKTTVCQTEPANLIPKLVQFVIRLRKLQIDQNFSEDSIFAMDETACWMDMPADTTVDLSGARSISLKTTGHEKDHYTVILTAKADGTKLKPYVVFKGKGTRLLKELSTIPGIIVRFSPNGWMNDSLTIDYLRTIVGTLSLNKRLMVWDAYRCHTSTAVKAECARLKVLTSIISGGCTKFIQAADVVWNSPFKSQMRKCYDTWLS